MEKIIKRSEISDPCFRLMFLAERHDHEIIEDDDGRLFWKADPKVQKMVDKIGIGNIMNLFDALGFGTTSDVAKEMYRKHGYSLGGYWEIFYWNEDSYLPGKPNLSIKRKKS